MRAWLLGATLLLSCVYTKHHRGAQLAGDREDEALAPVTREQRLAYLRDAQVWLGGDPAARDLLVGPPGPDAFSSDQEVACDFVEPRPDRIPPTGRTPKFHCMVKPGDDARVRYGRDNREIFGEVMGTRLAWALGFPANAVYPVKVHCRGCPEDPWAAYEHYPRAAGGARADRTFEPANITRRFAGVTIEECLRRDGERCRQRSLDQGVSPDELALLTAAPRAHVDALRLLMAFVQHGDDKPANQRLLCLPGGIRERRCEQPVVMIHDLGSTFGAGASHVGNINARSRASLADWDKEPLWRDLASCRANLHARAARPPVISEEGRRFLAALLEKLSDRQLHDLFTVARVDLLGDRVEDWVAAFKRKREQVTGVTCPP